MGMVEDIGTYLAAESVGTQGTDLFLHALPDTPVACVAVIETPGLPPEHVFSVTGPNVRRPRIQVLVRAATAAAAKTKADAAYTALDKVVNDTLSGTVYYRIAPVQEPFLLERDVHHRAVFAFNAQVERAP